MSSIAKEDFTDLPLVATLKNHPYKPRPRLTFGVELEFALATLSDDAIDPLASDTRPVKGFASGRSVNRYNDNVLQHLAKTIHSKAGVKVEVEPQYNFDPAWVQREKDAWVLTTDKTIEAPDEDYIYVQVEVISPPYYFSINAIAQVRVVCEIITNNFKVNSNDSCGLHVHVGNEKQGFHVKTLRSLLATHWTFEPVLDKLHPKRRRDDGNFGPSLRKKTHLTEYTLATKERAALAVPLGLEYLLQRTHTPKGLEPLGPSSEDGSDYGTPALLDLKKLIDLAKPSEKAGSLGAGRARIHVEGLVQKLKFKLAPRKTIEFRQHEATLNPDRVEAWIKFCVGMMEFCDSVDRKSLSAFLWHHIDDEEGQFTPQQLLHAIGLEYLRRPYTKFIEDLKKSGSYDREKQKTVEIRSK